MPYHSEPETDLLETTTEANSETQVQTPVASQILPDTIVAQPAEIQDAVVAGDDSLFSVSLDDGFHGPPAWDTLWPDSMFDNDPQSSMNFAVGTPCDEFMFTEIGNYDDDETFQPSFIHDRLYTSPSVDDKVRAKSGNFWTYIDGNTVVVDGVERNRFNYFKKEYPDKPPMSLTYSQPMFIEQEGDLLFSTNEYIKIKARHSCFYRVENLLPSQIANRISLENAIIPHFMDEKFSTFLKGGTYDEQEYPPVIEKNKVFTDHTTFSSGYYEEKKASNLPIPSNCFATINNNYNFYIEPYEDLIANPEVHETLLPNLYAFQLMKKPGTSYKFTKLTTLCDDPKMIETLGGATNQGGDAISVPPKDEYFVKYAERYDFSNTSYDAVKSDYTDLIVPYEDLQSSAEISKNAELFPMSVDISFKTDSNNKFVDLLERTKLSTRFAEYVAQIINEGLEGEAALLNVWEHGNNRSRPSANRIIDMMPYLNNITSGNFNVDYNKALYLGVTKDENIESDQFSIANAIFSLFLTAEVRSYIRDNFRTLAEVMAGVPAHAETIMYKIGKYRLDGEKVQEIFLPNSSEVDVHKYIDTQIKYGEAYNYKIFGYEMVIGSEYEYVNHNIHKDEAVLWASHRPSIKLIEIEMFSKVVAVLDNPPVAPDVLMVPFKGVGNKIRCLINNNIGSVLAHPISMNETEEQKFENLKFLNGLEPDDKVLFKSDDVPKQFEIFRITEHPRSYSDFSGKKLAILRTNLDNETKSSSIAFDDNIATNKKYYYIFRSVDVHNNISLPTEVYEVEMIDDEGVVYPSIKAVEFAKDSEYSPNKNMKRFLRIKPSTEHLFFDDQANDDLETAPVETATMGLANEAVWNKKFKLRLTSKQTGKKIDINFKFIDKPET